MGIFRTLWIMANLLFLNLEADAYKTQCQETLSFGNKCAGETPLGCHTCNNTVTLCTDHFRENILRDIFKKVSNETEHLEVTLILSFHSYLPRHASKLSFDGISRLKRLKYFLLGNKYINTVTSIQPIWTDDVIHEFHSLQQLNTFRIRTAIVDRLNISIVSVVEASPQLTMLDLSFTKGLHDKTIDHLFKVLDRRQIRVLCLRNVQTLGDKGFIHGFHQLVNYKSSILTNLLELDIGGNDLDVIPPGISNFAPNILSVDISKNLLVNSRNLAFYLELFLHPTIEHLNMSNQGYVTSDFDEAKLFSQLDNADSAKIIPHEKSFFIFCLNKATDNTNISQILTSRNSCNLIKCLIPALFGEFDCSVQHYLPTLDTLFKDNIKFYFPLGKNLKVIDFSGVHMRDAAGLGHMYIRDRLALISNNSLKELYFRNNYEFISASNGKFFVTHFKEMMNFNNLELLDISNNGYYLNVSGLQRANFGNLKRFFASKNNLFLTDFCRIFPNLTSIDFHSALIHRVESDTFRNCPMLQTINLMHNDLSNPTALNDFKLEGSDSMRLINLAYCNISSIGRPFLEMIDRMPLLQVDISHNPLSCTCSNQRFIEWVLKKRTEKFSNFDHVTCYGTNGKMYLSHLDPNIVFDSCKSKTVEITLITIGTALATLVFLSTVLFLYSKRWYIVYYHFHFKNYLRHIFTKPSEGELLKYKYDAFVSYAPLDRFWVHDILLKTLEDTYGFKLCIHFRDFPVGGGIAETIVEKMSESREVILIISNEGLMSEWCNFELKQAVFQTERRKSTPIIIILGAIPYENLNPPLKNILTNNIYLIWKEDQKMFWKILVPMMYGDIGGRGNWRYGPRLTGYQRVQ